MSKKKIQLTDEQNAAVELLKQNAKNNGGGTLSKSVRDRLTKARRNLADGVHDLSATDLALLGTCWNGVATGDHHTTLDTLLETLSKKGDVGLSIYKVNPFAKYNKK